MGHAQLASRRATSRPDWDEPPVTIATARRELVGGTMRIARSGRTGGGHGRPTRGRARPWGPWSARGAGPAAGEQTRALTGAADRRLDLRCATTLSLDIPDDLVVADYLADRKPRVSIARVDDRLYGFADLCPCGDWPCSLSVGLLTGTTVMCQCHGLRFDITTGAVLNGAASRLLDRYDVQDVDGAIRIRA